MTFAEEDAQIDYTSRRTSIEVLPDVIALRWDATAAVVLTGSGSSRDVSVYGPDKAVEQLSLSFVVKDLAAYVKAPPFLTLSVIWQDHTRQAQHREPEAITVLH